MRSGSGVGVNAPDDWEVTTRHLRGRGFTEEELLAGGLAGQGGTGWSTSSGAG